MILAVELLGVCRELYGTLEGYANEGLKGIDLEWGYVGMGMFALYLNCSIYVLGVVEDGYGSIYDG